MTKFPVCLQICFLLFLLSATSCATKTPSVSFASSEKATMPLNLNVLNSAGDCHSPSFFQDGTRVLALCRGLRGQSQFEIEEFDLENKQSRRLSWQDGTILDLRASSSSWILYSSTTDEIKESLFDFEDSREQSRNGSEIYRREYRSSEIQRLTQRAGEDRDPSPGLDAETVLFVSRAKEQWILQSQRGTETPQAWGRVSKQRLRWPWEISSGFRAWVEGSRLLWQKKGKIEFLEIGEITGLTRSPDRRHLILTHRKNSESAWFVHEVSLQDSCMSLLWESPRLPLASTEVDRRGRLLFEFSSPTGRRLAIKEPSQGAGPNLVEECKPFEAQKI